MGASASGAFNGQPIEPIGDLIARVRNERGKSQYSLANALSEASGNPSVDREYVSRWEKGRRIPTPYWRTHLSTVLGIPLDALDRAAALARARRGVGADLEGSPQRLPSPSLSAIGDMELPSAGYGWHPAVAISAAMAWPTGGDMNRAQFLSLVGATVAGAFAEEAYELLHASEAPGLSGATVSVLEQTISGLEETYSTGLVPAQQLVVPVGQHLAAARKMLSVQPNAHRQRLFAIAGQAAAMLGCLAFDLHDPIHARLYLHTAERTAGQARHPALVGYAIANRGLHALYLGDVHTGAQLAYEARQVADGSAPNSLRAWLAALEARALAEQGKAYACEQALEQAAAALARTRPDHAPDAGLTFFNSERFIRYEALCRAQFGQTAEARSLLERADRTCTPQQRIRRSLIRLEAAATYARDGDGRQACATVIQALDLLPSGERIAAITKQAKAVAADLVAHHRSDPAVRELHERLQFSL